MAEVSKAKRTQIILYMMQVTLNEAGPPPHSPPVNFGCPTRLAPLALEAHRILIHLQCQNLPGKVSLSRLLNHLSEPITLRAVKANSKRRLTLRHPQLG